MKKSYAKLLKEAPAHDSPAFIDYLRENNVVVFDNDQWIVIENVKYHTKEKPWLTAFWKGDDYIGAVDYLRFLFIWRDWNWLKKSTDKQTVKRFHLHLYRD